jgi:chloramphenicol-sensitive protein RarD
VDTQGRGIAAGATAYLLWGLLTIYWKQLHGLDPLQLTCFRIVLSAVLLVIALSALGQWGPLLAVMNDRASVLRLLLAAVLLSANWLTYVWAVAHDRIIETALGYFIAPLATMLIGILRFGEVASGLRRVALGLAAIAIVVLIVAYGAVPFVAIVLAGTWSIYGAIKRGIPLSPLQSLGGETFVLFLPAAVVVGLAGGNGTLLEGATAGQWVYVCFAGVVTAIPLLLFAAAARTVPFTILGPLNYLVPTINFLLGVVVYHEEFDTARLVGFALVWAGLVLVAVDGFRISRPRPELAAQRS